jgi:hypothetical protein
LSIRKRIERKEMFLAWSSCIVASVSIIALTLLAGSSFPLLIGFTPITSTAFAQQENKNNANNNTIGSISAGNINATSTTLLPSSSAGIKLSPQPVWQEQAINTDVTTINKTHTMITSIANGTLTLPDTGKTINVTTRGTLDGSSLTQSAYGRETVRTQDGQTSTITYYEIVESDPVTRQEKGIIIGVFDRNATGTLAPFNGMVLAGIYDVPPNSKVANVKLWKWESGLER